ncbi:MAG: hypothetical protein M0Z31_09590 [Clostridia bacterium]|nr:hypothetical protein [Clostridia bacterium]
MSENIRKNSNLIGLCFKSYITPIETIEGFAIGKKCLCEVAVNTTLGIFILKLFNQNMESIGLIAVNGQIASEDRILLEGDQVDIYGFMIGG